MTETLDSKLAAHELVEAHAESEKTLRNEKRRRIHDSAAENVLALTPAGNPPGSQFTLSLHVHRTTSRGLTRVVRLNLTAVEGVNLLKNLFRKLLESAFPEQLPQYLTSDEYYLFTPEQEFVSLPGDSIRTQFRLVAAVHGWETVIAVRELGRDVDPERRMLVTMAEFDSQPMSLPDGHDMVVSLVAYPSVSVRKSFLDSTVKQLEAAHATSGMGVAI